MSQRNTALAEPAKASDVDTLRALLEHEPNRGRLADELRARIARNEGEWASLGRQDPTAHIGGPPGWLKAARAVRRRLAVDRAALAAIEGDGELTEETVGQDPGAVAGEILEQYARASSVARLAELVTQLRGHLAARRVDATNESNGIASTVAVYGRGAADPEIGKYARPLHQVEEFLAGRIARHRELSAEVEGLAEALDAFDAALPGLADAAIGDRVPVARGLWESRRLASGPALAARSRMLAEELGDLDGKLELLSDGGGTLAAEIKARRNEVAAELKKLAASEAGSLLDGCRALVDRAAGGDLAALSELEAAVAGCPGAFRGNLSLDLREAVVQAMLVGEYAEALLAVYA